MVASSLRRPRDRKGGRERRRGRRERAAGRSLWEESGKLIPSPREDLDISRHRPRLFILPKRLDRDIPERGNGQRGRGTGGEED
jgi:hypothetical protein